MHAVQYIGADKWYTLTGGTALIPTGASLPTP
ncbi:hypothetical protein SPRI_7307 [Streptomyces pristinaespiralis]|uniref:Uncharacterized protein n=1 Tax=Streptomyces pristinaespiralis TaxID=38300 RepID=A0A0M4D451_STRPR|nr:hypothetical protein SPRI_0046 [Streptomyces pristinaespiralis]ALC25613.1 hypothetical protein SPRI_7307 [Streptomyces pristinaespiralis]